MNLKLFTLAALLLASVSVFPQFKAGVQVGGGYATVTSKTDKKGHISYLGGVMLEYAFRNKMVLHGELNYVNKGATLHQPEMQQWNGIINRYEFHLNYLELPLSVGYAFDLANSWVVTPRVGIYGSYGIGGYGLLLSDNLKTNDTPNEIRVDPFKVTQGKMPAQNAQYSFDAFQRPNIGLIVGCDADVSRHIRLSLTSRISALYPLGQYSDAGKIHLHTIHLSFAYLF